MYISIYEYESLTCNLQMVNNVNHKSRFINWLINVGRRFVVLFSYRLFYFSVFFRLRLKNPLEINRVPDITIRTPNMNFNAQIQWIYWSKFIVNWFLTLLWFFFRNILRLFLISKFWFRSMPGLQHHWLKFQTIWDMLRFMRHT